MFNVCPNCGEYTVEKEIDPSGPFAICPFCRYAHPFLQQPLFVVTGPSGAGKSTICLKMVTELSSECVVLETDILWGTVPTTPDQSYDGYRETWLRMAKNIGQAGRPVVLCGTVLPDQFAACPEHRYFSTLHYLAIVCDDDLLAQRLNQRPAWRNSGTDVANSEMIRFNRWLKENAASTNPPMKLYDSSRPTIQQSVADVARWVRELLP
jgi:predicted ABC-type ATPase